MKVRFLHIRSDFIAYLKSIDHRVQDNYDMHTNKKPYVSGILINVNGKKYIAPLTSPKEKYERLENKAIFKLEKIEKNRTVSLGIVLLNNMIPYVSSVVSGHSRQNSC